jgi:hypothetical protein
MKARKQESVRFIVKWIVGYTMHFRAFKRDNAACKFQEYLIEHEKISPEDVRVVMSK